MKDRMIQDGDWLFSTHHIVAAKRVPDAETPTLVVYLDHPQITGTTFYGERAQAVWEWLISAKSTDPIREMLERAGLEFPTEYDDEPLLLHEHFVGDPKQAFAEFLVMYLAYLRTGVKIVDVDPDELTVELKLPDGERVWRKLHRAAEILAAHYPQGEV